MKKALIYGLSLALVLSLTACHKPQAEQTDQSEPIQAATSEPVQDSAATPEPPEQNQVTPEQLSDTIPAAPDEVEDTEPPEETDPEQPEEQVQLFTDVNETVYATGTVNIRASYTADSDKLGSLTVGESVTRTGIAIEGTEAEGWSRVTLSSGTTAYISNSYLSTTKPAAQQQTSKPSGGQQQQQQQQQQQTPQGGGTQTQQSTSKVWDQSFYDSLTPSQQESYRSGDDSVRQQMQQFIEASRARAEEGYQGNESTDPEENLKSWSQITVGS